MPREPPGTPAGLAKVLFFSVLEPMRIGGTEPSPAQQPWPWLVCLSGYVYTDDYKFPLLLAVCILFLVPPSQHLSPDPTPPKEKKASFGGTIIFFN